jgi:hypothetical protein
LLGKYSARDWHPVIQAGIVAKLIQRFDCTAFRIEAAENEPAQPRLHDGAHAHDARF